MRRRDLLTAGLAAGIGAALPGPLRAAAGTLADLGGARPPAYEGPNVVLVRFGGGVRRRETLVPETSCCPWFLQELVPRGTLFPRMEIGRLEGVETSHGQGTLYLLTGRYDRYRDARGHPLGQRFEPPAPTLFERLRSAFDVPEHRALIVNGEDRTDEEFYSFSNHHAFGVEYRSTVLSLYRFKTYLLRRQLATGKLDEKERRTKERELRKLEAVDHRVRSDLRRQPPEIEAFWERWRSLYGESGLLHPRGDALLTELALRALRELRPRLMMIHYNDPDYVHWGNPSHYTEGIRVIDRGIRRLVEALETLPAYRDRTVLVVVPDCGRDENRLLRVPFQHHFGGRSSHEIFALFLGPGIARGAVVDRTVQQIDVAATVAEILGVPAPGIEGSVLGEIGA